MKGNNMRIHMIAICLRRPGGFDFSCCFYFAAAAEKIESFCAGIESGMRKPQAKPGAAGPQPLRYILFMRHRVRHRAREGLLKKTS
jgi:hypothetical protein